MYGFITATEAKVREMHRSPTYIAMMFYHYENLQTRMKMAGRVNIARWALRQKSKYFRLMKGGE